MPYTRFDNNSSSVMLCRAFCSGQRRLKLLKINRLILNCRASNQGVGGSSPSERAILILVKSNG